MATSLRTAAAGLPDLPPDPEGATKAPSRLGDAPSSLPLLASLDGRNLEREKIPMGEKESLSLSFSFAFGLVPSDEELLGYSSAEAYSSLLLDLSASGGVADGSMGLVLAEKDLGTAQRTRLARRTSPTLRVAFRGRSLDTPRKRR